MMLPPAKLPTSSLVYHNHGLLASHLPDSDTFHDVHHCFLTYVLTPYIPYDLFI